MKFSFSLGLLWGILAVRVMADDTSQYPDWLITVVGCLQSFNSSMTTIPNPDLETQAYSCVANTCDSDTATANRYQASYIINLFYHTGSIYESSTPPTSQIQENVVPTDSSSSDPPNPTDTGTGGVALQTDIQTDANSNPSSTDSPGASSTDSPSNLSSAVEAVNGVQTTQSAVSVNPLATASYGSGKSSSIKASASASVSGKNGTVALASYGERGMDMRGGFGLGVEVIVGLACLLVYTTL
ncbi:hypothetical protein TREMEDRAFT_65993 [Tremella mesenterica DSM 1558]|uniref:uncharacterized protein n=1 Tax=Tremella mesenterica (strain ATCC 24925 / CBS 8224 / DSM 1558 / NBRC 9311 / NRRL Y-6157 / RJB 2259-6 / UBC 559-6) TaxID=578456 RepID=UPI00032BEA76|nr:uncharacterized protein TREMEDRAFT_65993 [Tremella mesenterica DSM 1558]EIW65907.1 hypothetical protein TREMEDRAFT_65993 [Tremella mesenterica DSM 1558]